MRLIRLLRNDLGHEIRAWVRDGIIREDQAIDLCQRYAIDYHDDRQHAFGYQLLMALGYLFIGLAVITLLSANWDDIPRALRMGGLVTATIAIQALGVRAYLMDRPQAARLTFFLGNLMYGASIMLIAQIYHLGEHFPDGIYWWALGSLPAALLLKSRLIILQAFTLAVIWFLVESSLGYYPTSFPLFLAALLWICLRQRDSELLFLALVAAVVLWLQYNLAWGLALQQQHSQSYLFGGEHIILSFGLMVIAFSLSRLLASRDAWGLANQAALLDLWTLRLALILLLVMSFADPWRDFLEELRSQSLGLLLSLGCALVALLLNGLSRPSSRSAYAFSALFAIVFSLASLTLATPATQIMALQVIDNLLLIGIGIWLIINGIGRGMSHYFYLGIGSILVTGLLRYIDLVGDYVGASILFIVFSVILLAAARYWRHNQDSRS